MHKLLKLAKGRKKAAMQSTSSESSDSSDVSDVEDDDIVVLGSALVLPFMLLLARFSSVFLLAAGSFLPSGPNLCWPSERTPS
jgi:hypothetical protein